MAKISELLSEKNRYDEVDRILSKKIGVSDIKLKDKILNYKDKILHYFADKLKDYRTPDYDFVTACEVTGEAKKVFFTRDCSTIKELKDNSYKGLINVNDIIEEEFKDSDHKYKKIIFCDNDKVVCIYNSKNDSYYEDVHECFESAEKRLYIKCTDTSYQVFKEYINQSSKYHKYAMNMDEILYKEAYEKIFAKNNDKDIMKVNAKDNSNKYLSKSVKQQLNDIKKQQIENWKEGKYKNLESKEMVK